MKGRALRRALETSDAIRISGEIPLIVDTTEWITPAIAEEMLKRNTRNRPVNWKAVEKLAEYMNSGQFKFHAQGIILDGGGNILTGQTRLWAIVYSGKPQYMRVSRGSPSDTASLIDRGRPQSARDLSARNTDRRHSPTEASIARCVCVLTGISKPSTDDVASVLTAKDRVLQSLIGACRGTKKVKSVLMILGAICFSTDSPQDAGRISKNIEDLANRLDVALMPYKAESCWGKGASFGMALEKAKALIAPEVFDGTAYIRKVRSGL